MVKIKRFKICQCQFKFIDCFAISYSILPISISSASGSGIFGPWIISKYFFFISFISDSYFALKIRIRSILSPAPSHSTPVEALMGSWLGSSKKS